MLTVDKFVVNLKRPNHPDAVSIGVDTKNEKQRYVLSNGGMNNISCLPIENFDSDIQNYVQDLIKQKALYLKRDMKPLKIEGGKSIYHYSFTLNDTQEAMQKAKKIYFSNTFIRWQRTNEMSDIDAQKKLALTAQEFHQFREDELPISPSLLSKLSEVTGLSKSFWQNKLTRHTESDL